ncbi:MAG: FHA domain-containing protein [Planctomycetaceae bacterium]|nr:FHA domain-containing protein [Planctomycetaceae bacterium]
MHATLVVVGGKADKRQLNLELPVILGRSRQADLTIVHSLISRTHCELCEQNGAVLLRDLGSLNGTFCGDRRIQSVLLMPNDRFSIGPLTFEIRYESGLGARKRGGAGDVRGASGTPIELAEPIESGPVELDEAAEISGLFDAPTSQARRDGSREEADASTGDVSSSNPRLRSRDPQ